MTRCGKLVLFGLQLFWLTGCETLTDDVTGEGEGEGASEGEGEGAAARIEGKVFFEARLPEVDASRQVQLGAPETLPAVGLLALAVDRQGETLGQAMVDEDGAFSIGSSRPLEGGERVILATLLAEQERVVLAVLRPDAGGEPSSFVLPPWSWVIEVDEAGQAGEVTLTESDGSGALFIYLINLAAMGTVLEDALKDDVSRLQSLALLWGPGIAWDCGACYWGGGTQQIKDGPGLDQSIYIGGEEGGSSAWGYPVLLHEFGHYVAANYSRDDSPGGSHSLGETIAPPFAWSEGWASFFGVSTFSRWLGEADPLYWDIQGGSSFWLNLSSAARDDGPMVAPDVNGPPDQDLDEYYVASMLWHLWDGAELPEDEVQDGTALGTGKVVSAFVSARLLEGDRNAQGADFVDFVDAVLCGNPNLSKQVTETLVDVLGFPYDGEAVCD